MIGTSISIWVKDSFWEIIVDSLQPGWVICSVQIPSHAVGIIRENENEVEKRTGR